MWSPQAVWSGTALKTALSETLSATSASETLLVFENKQPKISCCTSFMHFFSPISAGKVCDLLHIFGQFFFHTVKTTVRSYNSHKAAKWNICMRWLKSALDCSSLVHPQDWCLFFSLPFSLSYLCWALQVSSLPSPPFLPDLCFPQSADVLPPGLLFLWGRWLNKSHKSGLVLICSACC